MDELHPAIRKSWGEISSTLRKKFVESKPHRLNAVIRAKERPTTF